MKFFRLLCLLPALVILLATCKEAGAPTDANGNPTGNVTTTLAGIVTDESGQPVPSAAIIANGKNTVTDKYGTFMIQNASVPGNRCYIICKKNGYFTGSRAEVPKSGGITELRLTLQSSAPGYTVNSSTGGTLTIGTASVKFPPSAFVTSDGNPFTGTVKVAAKHLDPSQPSFYNSFSGDMTARRTDGTQTELLSYGVLRVRLTDDAGNELKLAAGKTATLTYPIAASQQKTAPASMPLWYFDEALGMWKEEGVATKTGDFFSGEVSHFTDWNCDVPAKTGIVKGRVVCNNEGVAGIYVTVGQRKAITDSSGYFTCRVAANTEFTISINATVNGGFTAPDVAVSAVSAGEERVVTLQLTTCPAYISGVIVDCNDNPVAGTVVVTFSGRNTIHFTTTGSFNMRVPIGVDLSVEAISSDGHVALPQSVGTLSMGDKKDIGYISACGNGAEYYDINLGSGEIYSTVLSSDGAMIAISGFEGIKGTTSSSTPYFAAVYNVTTGSQLCKFNQDSILEVVNFSDDGSKLLLKWRSDSVYVVHPKNGTIIRKINNINHIYKMVEPQMNVRMLGDGTAIVSSTDSRHTDSTSKLRVYPIVGSSTTKDLSFNVKGDWSLKGFRNSSRILMVNNNSIMNIMGVGIIEWDITTDSKISQIQLTDAYSSFNGTSFSPDFSYVSYPAEPNMTTLNIYNTLTGAKLNSTPIPFTHVDSLGSMVSFGEIAVSNDQTYISHITDFQGVVYPPTKYRISDGKFLKVLATISPKTLYFTLTYSANCQFLAGIGKPINVTPTSMVVRIWKVK